MKLFLAAVVCIGLGGFLFWFMGPGVIADLSADDTQLQQTTDYRIETATCKTKLFVFGSCDIELMHVSNGEEVEFDYMIFGRLGGEAVYPLVNPDTGYLTTNIGIEYALNRLIMIVLMGGGLLVGGLFVLYAMMFKPERLARVQNR